MRPVPNTSSSSLYGLIGLILALVLPTSGLAGELQSPASTSTGPGSDSYQDERGDEGSDDPPPGEDNEPPPGHDGDDGPGHDPGGGKKDGSKPAEQLILDSPFEALETSCIDDRKAEACLRAGLAWKRGTGIEKPNKQQAANLFDAGCLFGSPDACLLLGRMYLNMETGIQLLMPKGTVSLDFGSAALAFQRACRLGALQGCGMSGDLYMEPRALLPNPEAKVHGIKVDMIQARQAWADGCNEAKAPKLSDIVVPGKPPQADGRSCLRLAQLHESGKAGVRRDVERSAHFYKRACYATGKSEYCDAATYVLTDKTLDEQPGEASVSPRADAPSDEDLIADTTSPERRSKQPHRPTPRVGRFTENKTGLRNTAPTKPIRFEVELGIGARWLYSEPSYASIKFRLGINVWFGLLGVGLEGGLHSDKFLQPTERNYLRMMQSLSLKLAIPIPIEAEKFYGELYLVLGGGATLGALELQQGEFMPTWGAREIVQLVAVTHAQRGPRQWGAIRFEQQQSLHPLSEGIAEHSSQVILLFGFTFGGPGPSPVVPRIKKERWKTDPQSGDPNPEPGTSPL